MATLSFTKHLCKGVRNKNSGDIMTMWKSQFNMPVPTGLFANSPIFTATDGPFEFYGQATSFDLSGFMIGWETLLGVELINITGPLAAGGYMIVQTTWRNPLGEIQFNQGGYSFYNYFDLPAISAGQTYYFFVISNQGVESYEFAHNGTHSHEISVSGSVSGSDNANFTLTNVPDTTNIASQKGMLWVEGNQLCYSSYQWDIHRITGYNTGVNAGVGNAGKFWVEGEDVAWVGSDGFKYNSGYSLYTKEKRSMRQVASLFSNGPTSQVNAGVGNAGKFWMDDQFGHQHIGFISDSGYKNLLYSGNYPWVAP